jgi:hypothetical protein
LKKWADNIDAGLAQWTHFGLATTQALFDAQTHRAEQNSPCEGIPEDDEHEELRWKCEDKVTIRETVKRRSQHWVDDHGVEMLGLPREAAHVLAVLREQEQRLLEVLALIGSPLQPLAESAAELKERFDEIVNQAILDALGVDIEGLSDMLRGPAPWMCRKQTEAKIRGTKVTVPLFAEGDRAKLDAYLGLDSSSHVVVPGVREGCARFRDGAELDPDAVGAIRNTILMGKLLLLEPAELDRLLGSARRRKPANRDVRGEDNVMTTGWHRQDRGCIAHRRRPRLAERRPAGVRGSPHERPGGTGRFPSGSCVLRAAFGSIPGLGEDPGASRSRLEMLRRPAGQLGRTCIETSVPVPIALVRRASRLRAPSSWSHTGDRRGAGSGPAEVRCQQESSRPGARTDADGAGERR